MTRCAPLVACVLLGCFTKPPFDGRASDAAVIDVADATTDDVPDGGVTANIAFVTSMPLMVGVLGLAAADTFCAERAMAGGLPSNTYVAWLSSGSSSAASRIGTTAQGWVRVDGAPIANTRANLTNGVIYNPIRLDEYGQDVGSVIVGTGTLATGATVLSADCAELTGATEALRFGFSDATRSSWTDDGASVSCTQAVRLYCFGTNFAVPVAPSNAPGRFAFVSSPWTVANGLPGADARCQSLADARSLPGTYVALLATTTSSAGSRLVDGEPWVRVDGVPLASTAADVIQGRLATSLNVDHSGTYLNRDTVFTGVPVSGDLTMTSTLDETCNDWTDPFGFATTGNNVRTSSAWYADNLGSITCSAQRLYCFQQ